VTAATEKRRRDQREQSHTPQPSSNCLPAMSFDQLRAMAMEMKSKASSEAAPESSAPTEVAAETKSNEEKTEKSD